MLIIPTFIAKSHIPDAGLGVFCREAVKAGQIVWQFMPGLDLLLPALPDDPIASDFIRKHGFEPISHPGIWCLSPDYTQFTNHSETPTLTTGEGLTDPSFAVRDLAPGTELTEDYRSFCLHAIGWGRKG